MSIGFSMQLVSQRFQRSWFPSPAGRLYTDPCSCLDLFKRMVSVHLQAQLEWDYIFEVWLLIYIAILLLSLVASKTVVAFLQLEVWLLDLYSSTPSCRMWFHESWAYPICAKRNAVTKLNTGPQNSIIQIIPMQTKQHVIWAQIFGPHKSAPITNGLRENFKRPVGFGNFGFALGSFRPNPAGNLSAV